MKLSPEKRSDIAKREDLAKAKKTQRKETKDGRFEVINT